MDINALWIKYTKDRDIETRNKIIEYYYYLVDIYVKRYYNKTQIQYRDDLRGDIHLGLIDAVEKFKLSFRVKFETYARYRILGSVKDGIRNCGYYSCTIIKHRELFNSLRKDFVNKYSREPENLQDILKISKYDDNKTRAIYNNFNIKRITDEVLQYKEDNIDFENEIISKMKLETIYKLFRSLRDRERFVITLYYIEEFTLKEIGDIMNCTESRVLQLRKIAISKLKKLYFENEKRQYIENCERRRVLG